MHAPNKHRKRIEQHQNISISHREMHRTISNYEEMQQNG